MPLLLSELRTAGTKENSSSVAVAADPIEWIACNAFSDDSPAQAIYQITQTSDLQFQLFSKSYVGAGANDVRGGMNMILDYIKTNGEENTAEKPHQLSFSTINTKIVGQDFAGSLPTNKESKPWLRWNKGERVNPYDRFGVQGLTFSNYLGEWKHLFINACEDKGVVKPKYNTGASSKLVRAVTWNICREQDVCAMPALEAPWVCTDKTETECSRWEYAGTVIDRDTVWHPTPPHEETDDYKQKQINRWNLAWRGESGSYGGDNRAGEMVALAPEVLMLQETPPAAVEVLCKNLEVVDSVTNQRICFSSEKFSLVKEDENGGIFPYGLSGSIGFDKSSKSFSKNGDRVEKCSNEGNGFTWATLQDKANRRSIWISMHTRAHDGFDAVRTKQAECVTNFIKNNFKDSSYPIVIGGDMNSATPEPKSWKFDAPLEEKCNSYTIRGTKDNASKSLCKAGYTPAIALATTLTDTWKNTFQGSSPWRSSSPNVSLGNSGGSIDSIWVNNFIGVGEYRVYAPAGIATSDHAAVSATLNLSGLNSAQAGDPQDPGTNKYYDTRLEPRSVWEDIDTSQDPRTAQFSKGLADRISSSFMTNLNNFIFWFTKLIVVMTIAFIGIAFADVSKLLGVTDVIAGSGGTGGVFGSIHDNIFMPMIMFSIIATAIYVFWAGIVKRQFRNALGSLLQTIFCFIAAVAIAVNPAWFISLPNNIAVGAQALIMSQMSSSIVGGDGLCETGIANGTKFEDWDGLAGTANFVNSVDDSYGFLRKVSTNVQSTTGCSLWYNLLLRPWSEGQFGAPYEELYGTKDGICDSTADGAFPVHKCLGNTTEAGVNRNFRWTGDPVVPLGNGESENNWALLHISTQTNAHSPILPPEKRGVTSKLSQGVSNDWWRVVDAVSNYDEKLVYEEVCDDNNPEKAACNVNGVTIKPDDRTSPPMPQPLETKTLPEWNDWAGNNQGSRFATVISSLLVASFAVLPLLFFSGLTAVYAIGVALLMAMAPVFFLFGCWPGRGQQLFKAWFDMVINVTMKRIGLGILTTLSIVVMSTVLQKLGEVGYWKSMIILALVLTALIANRKKVLDSLAWAKFSTFNLTNTLDKMGKMGETVTKIGTGAVVGGVSGAAGGGGMDGFKSGATKGFKRQFHNATAGNVFLTSMNLGNKFGSDEALSGKICELCNEEIRPDEIIYWHNALDGYVHGPNQDCKGELKEEEYYTDPDLVDLGMASAPEEIKSYSSFNHVESEDAKSRVLVAAANLDISGITESLDELVALSSRDIDRYKRLRANSSGKTVTPPSIPSEISGFVDAAAINLAWQHEEYEYIELAYASAWVDWTLAQNEDIDKVAPDLKVTVINNAQQRKNAT